MAGIFSAYATEVQVKVSVEGERQTYKLKKKAKRLAQENAVEKYLKSIIKDIPSSNVRKAKNEATRFITDTAQESSTWEWLIKNKQGQLNCTYTITIDQQKINQYIEEEGLKIQDKIELVILEEPPSLGQIKMNKAFGNKLSGSKFYIQNYTQFQRRTRDVIIKNVDKYGLSVKLLADQDEFKEFKSKDSTLLGVFFDSKTNAFAINRDLIEAIKSNYPDTIVLYYRIDSLIFDPKLKTLKVTVAFNMKNLAEKITKSVGSQSYTVSCSSTQKEAIIDAFGLCVEHATQLLMNKAGPKLASIIKSLLKRAAAPTGPICLYINGKNIVKKHRKKLLYFLRKDLVKKGFASKANAKIRGSNLTVKTKLKGDTEEFFFESLSPILESRGLKVDDDKVIFDGSNIKLAPEASDEEEDD